MISESVPYPLNDEGREVLPDFTGWEVEKLKDWVETWFYDHFCDPVHEMPYVDGEYHYIWGGPYDAREQIEDWFSEHLSQEALDEVVDRVESDGIHEWAPGHFHADQRARDDEYWAEQYGEWLNSEDPLANFTNSSMDLRAFLDKQHGHGDDSFVHRMMFMQAWAMLEALLADQLIEIVAGAPKLIARLYQGDKQLKTEKFSGDQLMQNPDLPKVKAIDYLNGISYHNLPRAEAVYGVCFGNPKDAGADTSPFLAELGALSTKRHDCVHRNGKSKAGETITITKAEILRVLDSGESFAKELRKLIAHYNAQNSAPSLDDGLTGFESELDFPDDF